MTVRDADLDDLDLADATDAQRGER